MGGRDCYIGTEAHLERTVLGDNVTVKDGARLVDCIVGDGERVEADATSQRIWSRPVPAGYPAQQVGNAL